MKLTFFGAAHAVTGSCHCLEVNGKKILIDCGLQQGKDEHDENKLDFAPNYIDYVLVTHAHIDHSGRIPLLVKEGFNGRILTTGLTAQLMSVMLRDSAHIQEGDANWHNQKGKRAGLPPVEPLYTLMDAEEAIHMLETVEYGWLFDLCEGVKVRFTDAGHLLGSSILEIWATEGEVTKKIVFSGDLGNEAQPIIRDPSFVDSADYVVMESTYGDRNHEPPESYAGALADLIDEVFSKGGNIVIPSFAVGRTQELLYYLREIKRDGLVQSLPSFKVYVDSPLARMCDAGRIRHHLKHNLWRPECAVVFVGYQGEGTLGRRLLEGARSVKLFGEDISVRAKVVNFKGLSSHADRDHLLEWVGHFSPRPQQVFVVHGDSEVTELFAHDLNQLGIPAHAPLYEEVYDLTTNCMLAKGVVLEVKKTVGSAAAPSAAYLRLQGVSHDLADLISRSRGRSNKDLAKLAEQLKQVMEKWA